MGVKRQFFPVKLTAKTKTIPHPQVLSQISTLLENRWEMGALTSQFTPLIFSPPISNLVDEHLIFVFVVPTISVILDVGQLALPTYLPNRIHRVQNKFIPSR